MKALLLAILALLTPSLCPGRALSAQQGAWLDDYYCDEVKKPFFAEVPGEKGRFVPQRKDSLPDSFLMPKPAGTKRVFVIGESVAALLRPGKELPGKNNPGKNFLNKLLSAGAGENAGIEIINCGMGGYESYRIYEVLKEILRYSPDLVVTLSGNNETKPESCPGLECDLRRRKFRLFERYFSLKNDPAEARKKALLKVHEGMLVKMAGAAKKAGVPLVFCTLPAALRDMPPGQPAPLEKKRFSEGYRLFYSGKYPEALTEFKLGLAAEPREPYFNFYTAKALDRLGRVKEAAAYYQDAVDFDPALSRSGRERNELIRRTAASEGACAADLEKLFRGLSAGGLPGFAEFSDAMHWNLPYNRTVWEEIFRAAGRCGIKGYENFTAGGPGQWAETSRQNALTRLGYAFSWLDERALNQSSVAELSRLKAEQPGLLKKAAASPEEFAALLPANFWSAERIKRAKDLFPFFLAHLAEAERRAGNHAQALKLCERALLLKPGAPLLKFELGQVLGTGGGFPDNAPAPALSRGPAFPPASKKNAALAKKLSDQAVDKIFKGDLNAAEKLSEEALKKDPFSAEALMNLCSLRQKAGQAEQALEACQRASSAVNQDPANKTASLEMLSCDAAFESYKILKALKREPAGVPGLDQCVKHAPPSWPGLTAAKAALEGK